MPRKFILLSLNFLLLSTFLSSCQASLPPAEKISLKITQTAAIEPSQTPLPSATPLPIATPKPTAIPAPLGCTDSKGKVEPRQMDDAMLGKPLLMNVYLPPCYNQEKSGGYPFLILLHGQSYNDSQWIDLGVPDTADRLMVTGQIAPFLVVMPQEDYYLEDMNTSKFGDSITQLLLPWIKQEYNVCSTRECTAIGGLSRGAIWAVMLGLKNGQIFGSIGADSLASNPFPIFLLREYLQSYPDKPRIYMDSGNNDPYLENASDFENMLNNLHLQHTWILGDGDHNNQYWSSHVEEYLRWYAAPWGKKP
jgi:enterochelin esterase-like enzyme